MPSGAPFHRARILGLTVAFIGCLLTLPANAVGSCLSLAQTEYERIYCQVFAKGEGAQLPSLEDFRRNDPRIQALLLKRPAARAGLELPLPSESAASEPPPVTSARSSSPKPVKQAGARSADARKPEAGLKGCFLEGEVIRCPDRLFYLASNEPNAALAPGALDENQRMGLSGFEGNRANESAVLAHLSDAYELYIRRMLAIGLGGATMSFTQFYHGFYRHEVMGVDFAERLEDTYRFLKQDKKANAVKGRFHDKYPEGIEGCTVLSAEILVCDDVATNWIYVAGD